LYCLRFSLTLHPKNNMYITMKKTLLSLVCIVSTMTMFAQSVREDIKNDVRCSASNHLAYPSPSQQTLTPAPDGYKPFYISHYGRHGSRYLIGYDEYDRVLGVLGKADSVGVLTDTGKELVKKVKFIEKEASKREGELSPLGALQHRQIARRMYERFPEVFEGEAFIDAKSTVVIRCILSMENELQEFSRLNPKLRITHDASEHDMYYMNLTDERLFSQRQPDSCRQILMHYYRKTVNPSRLLVRLFTDTTFATRIVDKYQLNKWIFKIASNLQNTESRKKISLYDLFTDDELYANWTVNNAGWYMNYGAYLGNGGKQPFSQRNLLRKIVNEADSCIARGKNGATLRFGHETMVLPLVCLLDINGYGLQTNDITKLERKGWINYKVFPMGANIQFVFYRSAESKEILVKVLLNENEARLPIKSKLAPYYKWSEVRDFYLQKLNSFAY